MHSGVCVLLRCSETPDEDVARGVDVAVGREVARGTEKRAVGQRSVLLARDGMFYCPVASACLARVLFSHPREACPRELAFEGQTLVD